MALRARRRPRRVDLVPDSESDEDDGPRVPNDSLPNVEPIDLSDDEDMAFSPPRVHFPQQVPEARNPVEELLNSRGVRPCTQWLESCLSELAITQPGFAGLLVARQAELCFGQFLMADFNVAGAASLPPGMHSLHGTELPGPFVLQVDEIIDVSHSLRDRYQEKNAGPGRTLKLSMTDGVQRVFGMEYRPVGALQVFSAAGIKISLKNVCVKRGLLMLVPEVLEVLGGSVEHLESARLRAVQVINKPPRGRRTRQGSVEPSLVEMATRAAWSANSEGSVASAENNQRPQQRISQAVSNNAPGTRPSNTVSETSVHHSAREDVQQGGQQRPMQQDRSSAENNQRPQQHISQAVSNNAPGTRPSNTVSDPSVHHSAREDVQQGGQQRPMQQDQFSNFAQQSFGVSGVQSVGLESRQPAGRVQYVEQHQEVQLNSNLNVSGVHSSAVGHMHQVDQHTTMVQQRHDAESRRDSMINAVHERISIQASSESNRRPQSTPTSGRLSLQSRRLVQSKLPMRPQPQAVEQHLQSTDVPTLLDLSDSQDRQRNSPARSSNLPSRVDAFQQGVPFTYLSILKDKTNSQLEQIGVVRGKVKCVITGVINFQYKDVDEFKLHIHIEDGSLITAAFVQHQLVQRLVGYSPQEVISGLKDPQAHDEMLHKMIQFQKLLERYEGIMELEFSDTSPVPTVLQMTEGVQPADVMLLLDRAQQPRSMQTPNTNRLVPTIDLSTP